MRRLTHSVATAGLVAAALVLVSQSTSAQEIPRSVIAAAGGSVGDQSFQLFGTFGEPIVGRSSSPDHLLSIGFWSSSADPSTGTPVEDVDYSDLPGSYRLGANYPNPFNPQTTISYDLPETSGVRLDVFDSVGRLVRSLVDREQPPGRYEVVFTARDLPSGAYFYRIDAGNFTDVGSMMLAK